MASYPTEEKRGRSWPDPQRSLIIQNDLVPASEVGRAPAVRILVPEASLAFERDQKLSLSADRYALGGGSPSPSSTTDLSYSQVNPQCWICILTYILITHLPEREAPSHHVPEMGVLTQYLLWVGLMSNVRHLLTITSNIRHCLLETQIAHMRHLILTQMQIAHMWHLIWSQLQIAHMWHLI